MESTINQQFKKNCNLYDPFLHVNHSFPRQRSYESVRTKNPDQSEVKPETDQKDDAGIKLGNTEANEEEDDTKKAEVQDVTVNMEDDEVKQKFGMSIYIPHL